MVRVRVSTKNTKARESGLLGLAQHTPLSGVIHSPRWLVAMVGCESDITF